MTKAEIDQIHVQARHITDKDIDLAVIFDTVDELFDQYRFGVRPVFAARAPEPAQYWFLSRFGKPMDGHSIRDRFARMMKDMFEPKLWNSMDVFLDTLSVHRL